MSTLLIVDDEVFAVEGIKTALDWKSIGIDTIQTAFNVEQAKSILTNEEIHIILCDIEMPGESGIDLLAWIRAVGIKTILIFLTAHADFQYAKDAIRLRGFDYLLKPVPPEELRAIICKALDRESAEQPAVPENTINSSQTPESTETVDGTPETPDTLLWGLLLRNGSIEKVRYDIRTYLSTLKPKTLNSSVLHHFKLDFEQILFSAFRSCGISAHNLLTGNKAASLYNNATENPDNFTYWVDFALDFLKKHLEEKNRSGTIVGRAKSYINAHCAEKLDCATVAETVNIHPDHLTRLFKKEDGLSVSAYIRKKKMEVAVELLETTTLPIIEVADLVGYINPAQFSTAFKKVYRLAPQEYRQKSCPSPIIRQ